MAATNPPAGVAAADGKSGGADPKVFAALTALIAGPYVLYLAYLWVHLQSGMLRPPVADTGLRQLLIVGTQRYCMFACRAPLLVVTPWVSSW